MVVGYQGYVRKADGTLLPIAGLPGPPGVSVQGDPGPPGNDGSPGLPGADGPTSPALLSATEPTLGPNGETLRVGQEWVDTSVQVSDIQCGSINVVDSTGISVTGAAAEIPGAHHITFTAPAPGVLKVDTTMMVYISTATASGYVGCYARYKKNGGSATAPPGWGMISPSGLIGYNTVGFSFQVLLAYTDVLEWYYLYETSGASGLIRDLQAEMVFMPYAKYLTYSVSPV